MAVSVILPTFNCGPYISRAIESVLAQTYTDWELLIVDDCSNDETAATVRRYADSRIRYERLDENRGPSWCRNYAIERLVGEWFTLLDADDYYGPDRLAALLEVAVAASADIVADNVHFWNEESQDLGTLYGSAGIKLERPRKVDSDEYLTMRLLGRQAVMPGLIKPLFRTEFIRGHKLRYDPTIRMSEDYLFYCECLGFGANFIAIPDAMYWYQRRVGSTSGMSWSRWASTQIELRDRLAKLQIVRSRPAISSFNYHERSEMVFAEQYWLVREAVRRGDYRDAVARLIMKPAFGARFVARRVSEGIRRRIRSK